MHGGTPTLVPLYKVHTNDVMLCAKTKVYTTVTGNQAGVDCTADNPPVVTYMHRLVTPLTQLDDHCANPVHCASLSDQRNANLTVAQAYSPLR